MTLTRVRDLFVLFVLFGVLGYLATRSWYLRLPTLSWPPGATLVVVAVLEFAMAARLRAVIGHDPEAKPMPAVVVARWTVLGRASAVAGALLAGLGAGFTLLVIGRLGDIAAAGTDLFSGAVVTGGSVALTVAGLTLERAGVAPHPDGDR